MIPTPHPDSGPSTSEVPKFSSFPIIDEVGKSIRVPGGSLPRSAVRIAVSRPRPTAIPENARWIHIDLNEQVLTAYEGDSLRYATLVSTGKRKWETPAGIFRVWLKLRHRTMRGRLEPYHVEEVPFGLFFHGDRALHGAAWHSWFGNAVSHGCVNLAPKDAAWLFAWSPPTLPDRWHGILPDSAGLETLWVQVERAPRPSVSAADRTRTVLSNPLETRTQ